MNIKAASFLILVAAVLPSAVFGAVTYSRTSALTGTYITSPFTVIVGVDSWRNDCNVWADDYYIAVSYDYPIGTGYTLIGAMHPVAETSFSEVLSLPVGAAIWDISIGACMLEASVTETLFTIISATGDSDGDGIFDTVDVQPFTSSAAFSDVSSGGSTTGSITDLGDQAVTIQDVASPSGVRATAAAGGGSKPAKISACAGATNVNLRAGNQTVITCGSVTAEIISGPIEFTFFADDGSGATSQVDTGITLTFEPVMATFTAPADNPEPVIIVIDGREYSLDPGETFMPILIDVKPDDDSNTVNLGAQGVIPVAVLTEGIFDAAHLDVPTLTLEGIAVKANGKSGNYGDLKDIDGDGDLDLLVHFASGLGLPAGQQTVTLEGKTLDGGSVEGTDYIRIVP